MDSKIEQVKKIITDLCDGCEVDGVSTGLIEIASKEIVSALYSEPQVICPKPEQMMICPKPCKDECGHKKEHKLLPICSDPVCPACIPVPTPASEGMLLTDEEIKRAWWDCYGEEFPATHGLVFGRAVRSRQLAKAQPLIEAPLRAEIAGRNKLLDNQAARIKELTELNDNQTIIIRECTKYIDDQKARIKELEIKTQSCGDCDKDISGESQAEVTR